MARNLLNLNCLTVSGETLGECLDAVTRTDHEVIQPVSQPVRDTGVKRSAADSSLFEREGRAVVFDSLEDLADRIDSDNLDVTPQDFLVLRNAGPTSESAMPEAGYIPIPAKLARAGVKDMVRLSDARISGTAYGTIVLHITPDAASGGPLSLVQTGDVIKMSVQNRTLDVLVSDEELAKRRAALPPSEARPHKRGYANLYAREILQADDGCDFQFLTADGAQ